jgi:hypothetical protein
MASVTPTSARGIVVGGESCDRCFGRLHVSFKGT